MCIVLVQSRFPFILQLACEARYPLARATPKSETINDTPFCAGLVCAGLAALSEGGAGGLTDRSRTDRTAHSMPPS